MSSYLSDAVADAPAHIIRQAQNAPTPRVAIARAGAPLPMLAAMEATQANMMVPLFTGERDMIQFEANELGWDISPYEIINTDRKSTRLNSSHASKSRMPSSA